MAQLETAEPELTSPHLHPLSFSGSMAVMETELNQQQTQLTPFCY
jgi:hypothetical protein